FLSVFLDAEVITHQVQIYIRHVSDGRYIAGAVPRRLHAVDLAQDGDLPGRGETTGLGNVHADVIDQPFANQRGPLVRAIEEFAQGVGGGDLLTDLTEVRQVFRREWIFHKEQLEL